MAGESRQDNRDPSFNQRGYSDRSRRGSRGNMSRGDMRGNRQKGDFRGRNQRGNFENKRDYVPYVSFRNQQPEEPSQQPRVAKFDGNKLSDPNEFPALNDMTSQTRNSRNSKKIEDSGIASQNTSNETKRLNWRGQGQNMFRKNYEGTYMDNKNQHISKNTNDGVTTPNYERNYDNSNRLNRGNYQYNNRSGRNNRRVNDGPRRNTRGSNIQPANYEVNQQPYDTAQTAEDIYNWAKMPGLFSSRRIIAPPSMDGHFSSMPGDTKQDHDDCNYYKARVNDDTLTIEMRVQTQLEFYFSDFNLKTDMYLRDMMDTEGYVEMDRILDFNRMVKLKTTKDLLKTVVEGSDKLEYDETKERIRRRNDPQQWTTNGLLLQIISVYITYLDHPNFYNWYFEAVSWIQRTAYPSLQDAINSEFIPDILVAVVRSYDVNTNQIVYFAYLYSYFDGNDYALFGSIRNFTVPAAWYAHEQLRTDILPPESIQYEADKNEFIDIVKGLNTNVENNMEIENEVNELTLMTSEISIDEDPIHLRNTKSLQKTKPAPTKYDRHSGYPQKNIKQENRREAVQQVHDGLLSYNHEITKKSSSTHGSLSTHPEAASKVFISSAPPFKKDTKENRDKNITVVEGATIVRNTNIINEAIEKFTQGEEQPIIITANKKNNQVNGRRGQKDAKKPAASTKLRQEPLGSDGQSRSK